MVQPPIVSTLTDRSYIDLFPVRRDLHIIYKTDDVFLKSLNISSQRRGSLSPQLLYDGHGGANRAVDVDSQQHYGRKGDSKGHVRDGLSRTLGGRDLLLPL